MFDQKDSITAQLVNIYLLDLLNCYSFIALFFHDTKFEQLSSHCAS